MKNIALLLLAFSLSPLLTGCGGLSVVDDKGVSTSVPARPLGAVAPLALSACVEPDPAAPVPDTFYRFMTSGISAIFSATGGDCDVRVVAGYWNWQVLANRTGRRLFTVVGRVGAGSNLSSWMPRAVYERLSPGTPLNGEVMAGRGAPGAAVAATPQAPVEGPKLGFSARRAPPAPARPIAAPVQQGLSASDIDRIARALKGADAPAPAAAPAAYSPRYSSPERPNDLAVVVGIESYSDIGAKANYAERDAEAFKAYVRALGVPERNIVLLTGSKAVRSALTKNIEGWLPRLTKADSRVYFYFSGHGAPDVKTGRAYLVPWDGDPNFLDATAYPVAQLYKKLGELPAKQILVAMDSCFSGAGGRSVLASGARPLVAKIETGALPPNLTVLAASGASEISGSLDDKRHGAFTYFLLEGLDAGRATPQALADYLTPRVQDEARRLNRDQTPQLQGDGSWSLR